MVSVLNRELMALHGGGERWVVGKFRNGCRLIRIRYIHMEEETMKSRRQASEKNGS